jgi:hypothetical protein
MSHRSVSHPSRATSLAKRVFIGAALAAAAYLAAVLASNSIAILGGAENNPSDADATASSILAPGDSREGADHLSGAAREFDYFPDHYLNQAREVAEQPPTF